jgi:uncharacterized OB-fold protein
MREGGVVGEESTRGSATPGAVDPRPRVVDAGGTAVVVGSRCRACGYPTASELRRCPECAGECEPVEFGPLATVFAATVLRVPVPGRTPPYALAYIDLDDGPRILAHVEGTDNALIPGDRVRVVGVTAQGDPLVAPDSSVKERSA